MRVLKGYRLHKMARGKYNVHLRRGNALGTIQLTDEGWMVTYLPGMSITTKAGPFDSKKEAAQFTLDFRIRREKENPSR